MEGGSRREFLQRCLTSACAGLGTLLFSSNIGCTGRGSGPPRGDAPEGAPSYLTLHRSGILRRRGEALWQMMKECRLCPRQCGAHRLRGEAGFCQATSQLVVASHHPHFGEERPLVSRGGSGTVFLTHCGLRCVFCINWEISQGGRGRGAKR